MIRIQRTVEHWWRICQEADLGSPIEYMFRAMIYDTIAGEQAHKKCDIMLTDEQRQLLNDWEAKP